MFFFNKKQKAIIHYNRMIKWAKKQEPNGFVNWKVMLDKLGEVWYGKGCSYCEKCIGVGEPCELGKGLFLRGKLCCGGDYCCNDLWKKLDKCSTWGEWIECANRVLEYIKENG